MAQSTKSLKTYKRKTFTVERLREVLHYDPDTGVWRWRVSGRCKRVGKVVGGSNRLGYWRIHVDGTKYFGHCLAVLYMTGKWPEDEVDHINGDPRDNRWFNLREASHAENMINRKKGSNNTSGFRGVCWNRQCNAWKARLVRDGKQFYLGHFTTPEEAHKAVIEAAPKIHGEFARLI